MLVALWQKRKKFAETNVTLAYQQHGFFECSARLSSRMNILDICRYRRSLVVFFLLSSPSDDLMSVIAYNHDDDASDTDVDCVNDDSASCLFR